MDKKRKEYAVELVINGKKIEKVVIDSHYEEKHSAVINDVMILKLVDLLKNEFHDVNDYKFPFKYYVSNRLEIEDKLYRIIWLLEENKSYIGILNAFRSSK